MFNKDCFQICNAVSFKGHRLILLLIICFCCSLTALADYYITFNDGRLYVFPSTSYKRMTRSGVDITFTAKDDVVYSYLMSDIRSIDLILTKEMPVFTSFKFNNKYNYQVYTDAVGNITDDAVNIEVAAIGKRLTASFTLSEDVARAYVAGKEQVSKESRVRFDNSCSYVVGYPGDLILSKLENGKYGMMPYGRTYSVNVDYSTYRSGSVPRIDINTVGGVNITSKDYYVDAEIIIDGVGAFPSMTDSVQIKGRGNDSWSSNPNSKNPYRLKFASKVKPFGLTKGKNWVLLANKRKGAMLSNAIGMKAASLIGTAAANHIIPVDLYINGTYKGSYNFTEKVGLAGNSIDLDDETKAALLELDLYYDEPVGQKFMSTPYSIPVNIKNPEFGEDSTLLTLNTIKQRFNSFVADLKEGNGASNHVDMEQLARYLMVSELICNRELFHPKSVFCYYEDVLDDDSKLVFGPLWDLDWAFGYDGANAYSYFYKNKQVDFYKSFVYEQYSFVNALRNEPTMTRRLYEMWKDFMENDLDELCEFCSDYYQYAKPSLEKNNLFLLDDTDYASQQSTAAYWIRGRANYIYNQLIIESMLPGDVNDDGEVSIADITMLIDYLLKDNSSLIRMDNADVDGSGSVNISDLTPLIDKLLVIN